MRLRFIGGEALGSLGDMGTLPPLTLGLIANNGINCGTALILFGSRMRRRLSPAEYISETN